MANLLLASSISVGFETLRANPLRTLLSTLGIVIGVAALVAVLSIGDGLERFARNQIAQTTDLQTVAVSAKTTRTVEGQSFPLPNPVRLSVADAQSLQQALGDTALVNMAITGSSLVTIASDTTPHAAEVIGLLTANGAGLDSMLVAGRLFTADEGRSGAAVAVISRRLARDVTGDRPIEQAIGGTMAFQGQPRTIIGITRTNDEQMRRALMPEEAAASAIVRNRPPSIFVKAPSVEAVPGLRQATERWALGRFGAGWKERLSVATRETLVDQARQGLLLFKVFMGALMSISLIVGGIGIMNVLLSSVIERTREIGIRKAAGAAQRDILWQFLAEAVTITGVGSVIGLLIGVGGAFGATAIMRHFTQARVHAWLSPSTVLVAIVASVLVGLAFGIYPALRAARLSPIDAIHHE